MAIIGLSGAGKSTLIKLVNKMIESTDGTLLVNDQNVSILKGKNLRSFRRKIGMVFQSFNLINRTSVINNVLAARAADMNFLEHFLVFTQKMTNFKHFRIFTQSWYFRKSIYSCRSTFRWTTATCCTQRTLSQNPSIILADEPVASLDPITANQIMKDFEKINKEENITILVNMHHVDLALKYANRVIESIMVKLFMTVLSEK